MKNILIGMCVGAMVLAACGGSSKASPKVSSDGGGNTTTTNAAGPATTAGGGSGGSGLLSSADVATLAAHYTNANIKVTYASSDSTMGSFTIAQDGNGKFAFSTSSGTFYADAKSNVSCQGTGATAKCIDLGSLGGAGASLGATFTTAFSSLASALQSLGEGHTSSETIAGRDAECVTYKASDFAGRLGSLALFKGSVNASDYDPTDSAKICVDKQSGFVLAVTATTKGKATGVMTATSVSTPSSSDFTPPVTPETIPSIPGVSIPTS